MGLLNWLNRKMMIKEAERLSNWAAEVYPVMKSQFPNLPENKIFLKMLFSQFDASYDNDPIKENLFSPYCISINGICYFLALNYSPLFKDAMNFRCIQFTDYMDDSLLSKGFTKQSVTIKKQLLMELKLPIE